jgi:hypothetical protein
VARTSLILSLAVLACSGTQSGDDTNGNVMAAVERQHIEPPFPMMETSVELHGHDVAFRFNVCEAEVVNTQLHDVVVAEPSARNTIPVGPFCRIRPLSDIPNESNPISVWEYGIPLPGYLLKGECFPLAAGKRYEIVILGALQGGAEFSLGNDGKIHVHKEECTELKAKRQRQQVNDRKTVR